MPSMRRAGAFATRFEPISAILPFLITTSAWNGAARSGEMTMTFVITVPSVTMRCALAHPSAAARTQNGISLATNPRSLVIRNDMDQIMAQDETNGVRGHHTAKNRGCAN